MLFSSSRRLLWGISLTSGIALLNPKAPKFILGVYFLDFRDYLCAQHAPCTASLSVAKIPEYLYLGPSSLILQFANPTLPKLPISPILSHLAGDQRSATNDYLTALPIAQAPPFSYDSYARHRETRRFLPLLYIS